MPEYYRNPLVENLYSPYINQPARSGFGYEAPVAIQAQCIYHAQICVRIENNWHVQADGFYKIESDEHLAILEQWYIDTCQS